MSASDRIPAAPAVLEWARESAGFDPSQAAKALGISETSLLRWEVGELQPTIKQLRKAADKYHRPLAVLLLPDPPLDFDAMRDFRRLEVDMGPAWSPQLHAEYKRALSQREVLLELSEVSPGSVVSSSERLVIGPGTDAGAAGAILRKALRLDDEPVSWRYPAEALKACIRRAEDLGVLVVQARRVSTREMQGFSVAEWPFPIVALNRSDRDRRRLFTLLHELAHLGVSAGGLCDLHETDEHPERDEDRLELYCNEVAAHTLMPKADILGNRLVAGKNLSHPWSLDELRQLSLQYGASSEAVLLHLVSLGSAVWTTYWERKSELEEIYAEAHERERERMRAQKGGPNHFVLHAGALGHGYAASVLDAFYARAISSLDVADYLDVRFDKLSKIEKAVFG